MSNIQKIIDKKKRQPNNVSFEEAKKILEHCVYEVAGTKGSHHRFKDSNGNVFILPHKNPIKAFYIKQLTKIFNGME